MTALAKAFAFRFLAVWVFLCWQDIYLRMIPFVGLWLAQHCDDLWRVPVTWFAAHVLQLGHPVRFSYGISDSEFSWPRALLFVTLALLAAAIWSALDRRPLEYERGWAWLRLFSRLPIAMVMIGYGLFKVIPVQAAPPDPSQLMTRLGNFTQNQLFWESIAIAPGYMVATGVIEVFGGALLVFRCTSVLGAALSAVALVQILLLNLAYDIGIKLLIIHMLGLSLILLAPYAQRLWNVLVANRRVDPLPEPTLTSKHSLDRAISAVTIVIMMVVVASTLWRVQEQRAEQNLKPPLYGAWKAHSQPAAINYFIVDGYTEAATAEGKPDAQNAEVRLVIELADGAHPHLRGVIKPAKHSIALTDPKKPDQPPAALHYDQPTPDQLKLTGDLNGQHLDLTLDKIDLSKLPLNKDRGIHWIQEAPSGG